MEFFSRLLTASYVFFFGDLNFRLKNLSVETIKQLFDLGCDVNAQNNDGMTCLHSSMWNENE